MVTPIGQIAGDSEIELKDANTTEDPQVFETLLFPEPGSIIGEEGKPVSVSNGAIILHNYLNKKDNNPVVDISGSHLYLTSNSKVYLFSNYMSDSDSASTTNTLINNFNKSTKTSGLFCNITSSSGDGDKLTIYYFPYVIGDGTNYYEQVKDITSDNLQDNTVFYFNAIKQDKIKE